MRYLSKSLTFRMPNTPPSTARQLPSGHIQQGYNPWKLRERNYEKWGQSSKIQFIPQWRICAPSPPRIDVEPSSTGVCYGSSIPPSAFFHNEIGIRNSGVHYAFTVVIPGNPLGPYIYAKGRYLQCESDAREDATFNMVEKILEVTGREIRDYNYIQAIMLAMANSELTHQVKHLKEKCHTHGYNNSSDLVWP
ncbi:uncharacterized protein DS421_20g689210 [Arachis hypogaea]|nr:uncharacterized protein DS421_20g689210 [Arachis hypogaea]